MADPYLGEIRIFAGTFAPVGWNFCDGSVLPISEYDALFNLLGTTYGGDGQNDFALPNLQSRLPVHQGTASFGQTFTLGEAAGTEEETLTVAQMPGHTHPFLATTGLANQPTPGGNVPAQSGTVQLWTQDDPLVQLASNAVLPDGGSQPHDNMHPFLCVNFIIALFGTFPSPT